MDVFSSPGYEPRIRLSFPCLFGVHGVYLACLCYLDTWDMTQRFESLYLKITHYEISHLLLELKKEQMGHGLEFPKSVCILAFCLTS